MLILDLLGMYFDAVVVFVTKSSLFFRLAMAILCVVTPSDHNFLYPVCKQLSFSLYRYLDKIILNCSALQFKNNILSQLHMLISNMNKTDSWLISITNQTTTVFYANYYNQKLHLFKPKIDSTFFKTHNPLDFNDTSLTSVNHAAASF